MTLWLVRAGKYGEREDFALQNDVAVIGWEELTDLKTINNREELAKLLEETYPDFSSKKLSNWESQIWPFLKVITKGDLIALPLKSRAAIAIGEFQGEYRFEKENPPDARHLRPVKWLAEYPRNQFGQDLLYSLGAAMTVCRIQRNNAEERVRGMLAGKKDIPYSSSDKISEEGESESAIDVEQYARDQISSFINSKFKGHGLERLVAAILQAQGYQVRLAPEGPDGGVDIVAGRGLLGFESPRLIVQVKSADTPVDVKVLREFQGVISNFNADFGLVVAWGGYRGVAEKEASKQFFKIRLWDADDLVQNVQKNYDLLPETIQAELPLKRIWTLVQEEE